MEPQLIKLTTQLYRLHRSGSETEKKNTRQKNLNGTCIYLLDGAHIPTTAPPERLTPQVTNF